MNIHCIPIPNLTSHILGDTYSRLGMESHAFMLAFGPQWKHWAISHPIPILSFLPAVSHYEIQSMWFMGLSAVICHKNGHQHFSPLLIHTLYDVISQLLLSKGVIDLAVL